MKVGAVDADQHKSLGGQYGVRGFPTIKIFGANKNKPEDYQGTAKKNTPHQTNRFCFSWKRSFGSLKSRLESSI